MNVEPLMALEVAFNMKWEGAVPLLLPADIKSIYDSDLAQLETARRFKLKGKLMLGNPHIDTICGTFDRKRIAELRKALETAEKVDGVDRNCTIKFKGQDLVIAFGWHLVEYVETEIAKRNTGGL